MAPRKLLEDPKRLGDRIRILLGRLERGQHVQNRDIEKVLTDEQRARFRRDLNDASIGLTGPGFLYPTELDRYFSLIDQGTAAYATGERLKQRAVASQHYRAADTFFERAVEALGEILSLADAQTRIAIEFWLDRPLHRTETGALDIGLDPTSVPRRRGSRSRYAQQIPQIVASHEIVKQIKIGHLNNSMRAIDGVHDDESEVHNKMAALRNLTSLIIR